MSIKLMVEVLDHYSGPDHKFRWLMAFAENARDTTRIGQPSRMLMTRRTRKSAARVSNIASELVEDGVLARVGGGGKHRGSARYRLLPLAAFQGSPATNPENAPQGSPATNPDSQSQGSPATNSQGSSWANPEADLGSLIDKPSVTPSTGGEPPATAQTILTAFIDWDRASGGKLTRSTVGQLARAVGRLLDEGIEDRFIRHGLANWRAKGQHPATLDSFVNAAMAGRSPSTPRPSIGDRALAESAALKAQLLTEERELA